jgi:hypothetical protein
LENIRVADAQTAANLTTAGETNLATLARQLPSGYVYKLDARVKAAQSRLQSVAQLNQALLQTPVSEAKVVEALRACERAQAMPLLDAQLKSRAELAKRRAPALDTLKQVSLDLPLDKRDALLLDRWRPELLAECKEADRWRRPYEDAVARKSLLAKLKKAVDARNEPAITQ